MPETSIAQVNARGAEQLFKPLPKSFTTYRTIRKHPAVALARTLSVAPIVAGTWSVGSTDNAPSDAAEFIEQQLMPIREPLIESAMFGGIDFGYQPFEKVFEPTLDGRIGLHKLKALLQDLTEINVDKVTGAFMGYKQESITIPLEQSFNVPFRVEGTNWFGESLLENARTTYNEWAVTSEGSQRYNDKIAGSMVIIKYPWGTTKDENGVAVSNAELADQLLDTIASSGAIAIPKNIVKFQEDMKADPAFNAWEIDFESDGVPRQYSFVASLEYLDKMLIRCMLVPERVISESKFGTKAEVGEHADLALTHMDLLHRHITRHANWHLVNHLLLLNYGEGFENTVFLEASPLSDSTLKVVKEIYLEVLKNPLVAMNEMTNLDLRAMTKKLGINTVENPTELGDIDLDEGNISDAVDESE